VDKKFGTDDEMMVFQIADEYDYCKSKNIDNKADIIKELKKILI
jgi:hypothetical protein